jgi:outer membrane protein assembly factor BamB
VGGATDLILLGGEKGDVLAYNAEGQLRWKSRVSSEVLGVPQLVGNVVIVRSGDGHVVGLNADDGRNVWSYERSLPALVVRSHAGVTVRNGVAYAGFAGGKLVALNVSDGTLLWEASVSQPKGSTELERISDIISDPVVDSEQVCAVAFQGGVACFSPAQGNALWTRDVDSDKGLALLRKHLYFSDAKGVIYALDKDTGSTLWRNDKFTLREGTVPFSTEKFLVFGDLEGYLHVLNREDGSMAARIQLESGAIQLPPIEMDGGLLVQACSGSIYSLSLQ